MWLRLLSTLLHPIEDGLFLPCLLRQLENLVLTLLLPFLFKFLLELFFLLVEILATAWCPDHNVENKECHVCSKILNEAY